MLTDWGRQFPNLRNDGYKLTSAPSFTYNCIAWAAGDDQTWWEPDADEQWFWPKGVRRAYSLKSYVAAYEAVGFKKCETPKLEAGVEKIAIFILNGKPSHAARQLDTGFWTSKLGPGDDIQHTLDGLNGNEYGEHSAYLSRRR